MINLLQVNSETTTNLTIEVAASKNEKSRSAYDVNINTLGDVAITESNDTIQASSSNSDEQKVEK